MIDLLIKGTSRVKTSLLRSNPISPDTSMRMPWCPQTNGLTLTASPSACEVNPP